MNKLFKAVLLSLVLVFPTFAVESANTFFLLPSSIQEKIIIFEKTKPRKIYFVYTETEKCWWNKYKLTIHF